ncbi:helix-turn-helix domain-containing protein [Roseiconus lacunae]|uniref:helix-turn-helix domain-containing protein n=1 Tax=Roseiconus lacunae TaxID=2605694 RepID=UPI0030933046|nr:helix-turn-helix domain-containing protein [Stieleria sp. HD01]
MHSESLLVHNMDAARLIDAIATKVVDEWRAVQGDSSDEGLVNVTEMARLAGVSPSTIERLTRSGAISSCKVGARRLYRAETVLDELSKPSSEPAKEPAKEPVLSLDEAVELCRRGDLPEDLHELLYERLARRGHNVD